MAKFEYTSLLSRIRGKINAGVFEQWKGLNVSRRTSRPRQTRTSSQQFIKFLYSKLSSDWQALSLASQTAWNCYASTYPDPLSGFNAYIRNNTILLYLQQPQFPQIKIPPSTFWGARPVETWGFSWVSGRRVQWYNHTFNQTSNSFQCAYSLVPGFRDDSSPMWKVFSSSQLSAISIRMPIGDIPRYTIIRARMRHVDTYGHVSVWSAVQSIINPFA